MRISPMVGAFLLAGCGPALVEQPTVRVHVVVAPQPEPVVVTPLEPEPVVVAPTYFAEPVQRPVHYYVADPPAPVAPTPPPAPPPPTIQCPGAISALAGEPVTLAATGSAGLTYSWTVVGGPRATSYRFASQYDGQSPAQSAMQGSSVPFVTPIIGSYTLAADGVDALGRHVQCETPVVVHGHGLRVELSWNTNNTDVDLHMITTRDPRWVSNADCYYANRRPATDEQDPGEARWLDTDDTDGEGPENIRVDRPDGQRGYIIGVHYYSSHGQPDPTTAIVVVYCGDRQVARFERNLVGGRGVEQNDFWQVATVHALPGDSCTVQPIGVMTSQGAVASRTQ